VNSNWDIFLKLKEISLKRGPITDKIKSTAKAKINTINIDGNKEISDSFILEFIGLEKGTELDLELLDSNISKLYSLGYFKTLFYEIYPNTEGMVDVVIKVDEGSLRKFQLGIRWDNYYDLVGVANVQLNSNWIPGLRIENQTQFAGLRKNEFSIYYPSRKMNFPVYPFLRITNSKYNYQYYYRGNYSGRYTLLSDGFTTGIGLLLKN